MKILLFGGTGQLGFEIIKRAHDLNFDVVSPVTSEVDITDARQVNFLAKHVEPDIILNCAAYTAVDKAEQEVSRCFAINKDGARIVAEAAAASNARLIHISTNYVFGTNLPSERRPLREDDPVGPLSVYGQSKLEGEEEVKRILGEDALIVRTSSLYGMRGANFPGTMLRLFKERELVKVVNDQLMSPTWAGWLAETLLDLSRIRCGGVLHATNQGSITWYEFAHEVLTLTKHTHPNGAVVRLEPTSTEEYKTPAVRPPYSVLDCSRLESLVGRRAMHWRDGLVAYLKDIEVL